MSAVEVTSPSSRLFDLNVKKARFEVAGTRSYRVVDPDAPSVTVWELGEGGHVEVARACAAESLTVARPFPLTLVPARLVA